MINVRFSLVAMGYKDPDGEDLYFANNVYNLLLTVVQSKTDDLVPWDLGDLPTNATCVGEAVLFILRRVRNLRYNRIVKVGYDGEASITVSVVPDERVIELLPNK